MAVSWVVAGVRGSSYLQATIEAGVPGGSVIGFIEAGVIGTSLLTSVGIEAGVTGASRLVTQRVMDYFFGISPSDLEVGVPGWSEFL